MLSFLINQNLGEIMESALKEKLTSKDKWLKFLCLVLFSVVNYFVQAVSWFVALFQFIATLMTDKPNQRLQAFGKNLSIYSAQIINFLTYSAEEKPFPFSDWPKN